MTTTKLVIVLAIGLLLLIAQLPSQSAALTHNYNLTNSLNDTLGGPSLVSDGGSISSGGYTFVADQGLSLSNAVNPNDYSVEALFSLDSLNGYRKIVDFKNLSSDDGLYDLNTDLNYFNFSFGPTGAFTPGQTADVVLTRDNTTGLVVGYVNGVQQISFTDSSSDAVFNAPNNIINFFNDDNVTGGRESSSGVVKRIQIYDGALSASDVATLNATVPEPSQTAVMSIGALGLAVLFLARRRRVLA